jgi:hypothetical protein
MKRKASALWAGGLKDGKGKLSTDSGVLSNTVSRVLNAKLTLDARLQG